LLRVIRELDAGPHIEKLEALARQCTFYRWIGFHVVRNFAIVLNAAAGMKNPAKKWRKDENKAQVCSYTRQGSEQ
jgi:hypothetical protein